VSGILTVKHADGLAPAVQVLGAVLAGRRPADGLRPDWVLIQSRPMAQWMTLELARHQGACAGIHWLLPARFIGEAFAAAGVAGPPEADPWRRDALAWRVLARLPGLAGSPAAAYAARGGLQAWQLASRVADRFDTWQLTRPDWLAAWEAGGQPPDLGPDPQAAWIGRLWRELVADGQAGPSRASQVQTAAAALRGGTATRLPRSLTAILTGPVPGAFLDLVEAFAERLGSGVAVVVTPSILEHARATAPRRAAARGHEAEGHRLLATLGGQGRRWVRHLEERAGWEPQPVDGWSTRRAAPEGILGAVQAQVAANAEPGLGPRLPTLAETERSLRIHRCPGPVREAEVLRDELLRAFHDLPGLTPGDVLVLVPDLDLYAPLVRSALESGRGGLHLGSVVTGTALATADPAAAALLAIVHAAAGDAERSRILALIDLAAIRARLGLDAAGAARLRDLLDRAGVSVDRDPGARAARLGLPDAAVAAWAPGTWRHALDRLLAGYAAGPLGRPVGGVIPASGATAPDAELLGRFATWWEGFTAFAEAAARPLPASAWADLLAGAVATLLGDDGGDLPLRRVIESLDALRAAATWHDQPVEPAVALDAVEAALAAEAPLAAGLDGRIVVAGIAPFRAIPARVIALMGMSGGNFPRPDRPTAWDPARHDPRPGERSPRADDRQLFLDAVMSATDRLIITAPASTDRGDRAEPAPLSPCVDELLDAVDDVLPAGLTSAALVAEAPLTPYSPRLLASGDSWDQGMLDLAAAIAAGPVTPREPPFLPADLAAVALPAPDQGELAEMTVAELVRFWRNPSAAWLAAALGVDDRDEDAEPADEDPLDLGAFAEAGAVRQLVEAELTGDGLDAGLARLHAAGQLPLGAAGATRSRQLMTQARDLLERAGLSAGTTHQLAIDLAVDLPAAVGSLRRVRLAGAVPGRVADGTLRTWTTAGGLSRPRQRLEARIRQLVAAVQTGSALPCRIACRRGDTDLPAQAGDLRHGLAELCRGALAGRVTPLPFFPATTWKARTARDDALSAGLAAWLGGEGGHDDFAERGECDEPGVRVLWRGWRPDDTSDTWRIGEAVWSVLEAAPPAEPEAPPAGAKKRKKA
jgi:exodeoxyribonuclease V gamma subunit